MLHQKDIFSQLLIAKYLAEQYSLGLLHLDNTKCHCRSSTKLSHHLHWFFLPKTLRFFKNWQQRGNRDRAMLSRVHSTPSMPIYSYYPAYIFLLSCYSNLGSINILNLLLQIY